MDGGSLRESNPPSPLARAAAGFEDREGHRTPVASIEQDRAEDKTDGQRFLKPLPDPACVNCGASDAERAAGGLLEQANFTGARPLGGVLDGELNALALTEQFEHGPADRGPVEEVLDAAFVANKPETLINQQSRNRAVGHDGVPLIPNRGRTPRMVVCESGPV